MSDPISDGILADSVAAEAREAGRQSRSRSRFTRESDGNCSNCGTPLKGRVCHSCGQDADSFHRPIWSLFWEIMDGMFSIDGKAWRTVPALLFRPGHVTRHYLSGVRGRYVQPFRLYLITSLLFFLLFQFNPIETQNQATNMSALDANERAALQEDLDQLIERNPEVAAELQGAIDALGEQGEEGHVALEDISVADALNTETIRQGMIDGMRRDLLPEDYLDDSADPESTPSEVVIGDPEDFSMSLDLGPFSGLSYPARQQLANQLERIINEPDLVGDAMLEWLPRLLFVLLPVYALIIAIGQIWRRGFYFYDHLIVSLHFHSVLFIYFILAMILAPLAAWLGGLLGQAEEFADTFGLWAVLCFLGWSNYYLYRIHRTIYEHGRFMSIVRTLTLDLTYLVVLSFAAVVLMILAVLFA